MRRLKTAILVIGVCASLMLTQAQAAAPKVGTQAPGFYRLMLGDFEVTVLSDGSTIKSSAKEMLHDVDAKDIQSLLDGAFQQDAIAWSFNAFLVNTGRELVLIDTGAGSGMGPAAGNLITNMRASGYQPEQVDEVLLTHFHPDHSGGLIVDGKRLFVNARIRANKLESDYWLSQENMDRAPAPMQPYFKGAAAALAPYIEHNQYKPFTVETGEIAPGITMLAASGHTPGHTAYVVESKAVKLILWGDTVHMGAVQFHRPRATFASDVDPPAAVQSRVRLFEEAAHTGVLIGGSHLPFPGLGHVRKTSDAYEWVPLPYSIAP
jgi:glyoxylase-like metal-dependent hydrolase (beta-lactamase superfamily II)